MMVIIEKFKNIINNVIDGLILLGERSQTPRFIDNYIRTLQERPGYPDGKSIIDSCDKEFAPRESRSKAVQSGAEPALSGNVVVDKVLVAK